MKRLRHPKHGYHVVSYGDDLAALSAAGWVPDEPTPSSSAPQPQTPAAPTPAPEPQHREPWRPRRNR